MTGSRFNTTEEIIDELRAGRMVIIVDDEDRENEGDLLIAADCVTPESINFMMKHGCGIICVTMTREHCERLNLPLMVNHNRSPYNTAFTVSIEAAEGVTTGVSAADRSATIRAAVASGARPEDLVQPGHIFPVMAQPGGVLVRAGHTEAGCDLTRMAGLTPAAAIVEIVNDDGSMARRPQLEVFAETHGLKIGTIADLIHYRVRHERSVVRESECDLPTPEGIFRLIAYRDTLDGEVHLTLTLGDITPERPTLVRVHLQNTLCDLFGTESPGCGWPLRDVMRRVAAEGAGVIVVLRTRDAAPDILARVRALASAEPAERDAAPRQDRATLRTYGIGAQILADLGVCQMRVMSAPRTMSAISGFDLEIVEYVGGR